MRPQGGGKEAETTPYRKVKLIGHPLAHADGVVYLHRLNLWNKIGAGIHPCHWCGTAVVWNGDYKERLVTDHLDGDGWNNVPSNLVPSCIGCNVARLMRASSACENGHPWTEKSTYIRTDGGRMCRLCARVRDARRRARRKLAT